MPNPGKFPAIKTNRRTQMERPRWLMRESKKQAISISGFLAKRKKV